MVIKLINFRGRKLRKLRNLEMPLLTYMKCSIKMPLWNKKIACIVFCAAEYVVQVFCKSVDIMEVAFVEKN